MNNVFIKPTKNTPFISFESNGNLRIEGRSYPNESINFFQPLFSWAEQYRGEKTIISIKLEYFNTSTCKQLLSLLRLILDNNKGKSNKVKWYYEENDLDILEIGQHMQNILKMKFEFNTYAENEKLSTEF